MTERLYFDWASRAPKPLPHNFVHAEWITLHDNPKFRVFVDFLRVELDRIGPSLRRSGLIRGVKVISQSEPKARSIH